MRKTQELLNAEGTILGLYEKNGREYLGSYLKDIMGTLFYTFSKDHLQQYYDSKITLMNLFLMSEEYFVEPYRGSGLKEYSKDELAEEIKCGKNFYRGLSSGLKPA